MQTRDVARRYTSRRDLAEMFLRQNGKCKCGTKLVKGNYIIEHRIPLALSGLDVLENKYLNCKVCAHAKTFHPRGPHTTIDSDIHTIAKIKRLSGEHTPKKFKRKIPPRPMPGTKTSGWRKKFNGKVERR